MKRYEYLRLSECWGKPILLETINRQASEGWRLINVSIKDQMGEEGVKLYFFDYLFEKELEEMPDELPKEMD
jgi:hypothetical protein